MKKLVLGSWRTFVLLLSLVAVTTACDDEDEVGLNLSPAEFVQQAAVSDMFEIETGEMATEKSETEMVVDFGQMLVDDHTMSSTILMTIAAAKNIDVPTTLTEEKQAIRDRLAGKEGMEFDKDFANAQVEAHEEAIALYQRAVDELEDEELRTFAENVLPVLQEHLQEAQVLEEVTDAM